MIPRSGAATVARRRLLGGLGRIVLILSLLPAALPARADAVDDLRRFGSDVRSARADFVQTVLTADGAREKTSAGHFEFARPDRFRFVYVRPFEQTIVGDGKRVWVHDPDLNQVSSRAVDQALGATPAALLAGGPIERNFELRAEPDRDGLNWVRATPKIADGPFRELQVGFQDGQLRVLEILDSFGQRSTLRFERLEANPQLPPETFRFVVPPGADLIEQ